MLFFSLLEVQTHRRHVHIFTSSEGRTSQSWRAWRLFALPRIGYTARIARRHCGR